MPGRRWVGEAARRRSGHRFASLSALYRARGSPGQSGCLAEILRGETHPNPPPPLGVETVGVTRTNRWKP